MKYLLIQKINFLLVFSIFCLHSMNTVYAQENELDNLLALKFEELSDVKIISASKRLQRISEVPAVVKVITADDIKHNQYFTLEDALADLPGFQFRNIIGFNSYVFQRGVPNQNNLTLLLVDGIQINELNSGGFYGGGQFNLDNVERIEVVYGPASVLYGTNAISGVINIITKSAKDQSGIETSLLFGSFNTFNANISYGYYDEETDFGIRASGMFKSSHKADLAGLEGDNNWSDEMENFEDDYSFDSKIEYKNFSFGFNFQNKRSSRTTLYKSIGTNYIDKNTLWNIWFLNSYLKYYHNINENTNLFTQFYYRNSTVADNTIAYVIDTAQVGYYRPNNLIGLESIISYSPNSDFNLIGGILFEYETLSDEFATSISSSADIKPAPPGDPSQQSNHLYSIYIQAQYAIIENLKIIGGARNDFSSVYDNVFTPSLGIIHKTSFATSKLLYSEAFRAPKPWDYTSGSGNSRLQPEEIKSLEFSTSFSIIKNLPFRISLYKNLLDKKISRESFDNNYRWINEGEMKTDGLELELKFFSGNFTSYFNYTYNYTIDEEGVEVPEIAKHNANIGISYSPQKNLRISIRGNYLGARKNTNIITATGKREISDAFVVHSTLSYYNFYGFNLHLICKNLFDKKYFHTSNVQPERYRQPQRTIMVKLEYELNDF